MPEGNPNLIAKSSTFASFTTVATVATVAAVVAISVFFQKYFMFR
jgi:hypothetical protein